MANVYSYKDFEDALMKSGQQPMFSDADMRLAQSNPDAGMSLLTYKQQYQDAKTQDAKALAHAGAEEIRRKFGGYSGGTAGADFKMITAPVATVKPFEYDAASDPVYSQYRKQFLREGKRAVEDTMGTAAAMTGGIPSSHAVTAAGQAGNYYNAQLTDKIPELYQQAYNRYLNEFTMQQQAREAALQEAQVGAQYGDYTGLNNLGINTSNNPADYERRLNEAMLAAQYGDYSKLEAMGINMSGNPVERERLFNEAMAAAQYGDYSKLQALGIDITNADYDRRLAEAQLAAQLGDYSKLRAMGILSGSTGGTVSGGGSGGGYSGGSYSGGGSGGGLGTQPNSSTVGSPTNRLPGGSLPQATQVGSSGYTDLQMLKYLEQQRETDKVSQGYPSSMDGYRGR